MQQYQPGNKDDNEQAHADKLLELLGGGPKKEIDITQYLFTVWRRKWLVVFITVVGTLGVGAYAWYFVPTFYKAESTIRIAPSRLYRSVSSVTPGTSQNVDYKVLRERVLSYRYLSILGRRLELEKDEAILNRARNLQKDAPEDMEFDDLINRVLSSSLRQNLSISGGGSTGLFKINAIHQSPIMAYELSKTLSDVFMDESKKAELSGIRGVKEFSDEQLSINKKNIDNAEFQLKNLQKKIAKRQAASVTGRSDSLGTLNMHDLRNGAEIAIAKRETKIKEVKALLARDLQLAKWHRLPPLKPLKQLIDDKIREFKKRITMRGWSDNYELIIGNEFSKLRQEGQRILNRFVLKKYADESQKTRENIIVYQLGEIDLYILNKQKEFANEMLNKFLDVAELQPEESFELRRLQAKVERHLHIYNLFYNQSRGSQIEEALQNSDMDFKYSIVERARVPIYPTFVNKKKIALLGFVVSMGLSIALIFALDYLSHTIKTVEDVENILEIPVWGVIPGIKGDFLAWYDEALRIRHETQQRENTQNGTSGMETHKGQSSSV